MGKDLNGKELGIGLCQRKDGRYMARCKVKNKRVTRYFEKRIDARVWITDVQHDVNHGIPVEEEMTLNTWFAYWMDTLHTDIRESTRKNYISYYDRRIKKFLGDKNLTEVRPLDCAEVMSNAYAMGDTHGSMVKIKSMMRSMFTEALENGLVTSNPVTKSIKAPKTPKKERVVLTVEQEKEFLQKAAEHEHFDEFAFILNTGIRTGELQGLKWSDVDFDKGQIHIRRTMYHDKGNYTEHPPKTNAGDRFIPLTNIAFEILVRRKEVSICVGMDNKDYVFLNNRGKITNINTYNKILKAITQSMGIERFSMHNLRHTFATRCIEGGMMPKVLQIILGHENLSMTMDLYVHVPHTLLVEEMMKFNSVKVPKTDKNPPPILHQIVV